MAGTRVRFQQEYAFKSVELFKSETLGTGAYGVVCKAKCDQLICAAKLLYPVLFKVQVSDPGKEHRQPMQRFEQECQFLSQINHPNIVQYLGTYHDSETNSPVLLMELMDESLTHYLDSAPEDIPYHIQVNISYDIAQALAFLHANGIIHRDLSSNNVLLLAGRAKVADFGMSKFAIQFATMTTCPGTPIFMPPEALDEPPVYTEKLDNFSLGVLIVQIITRKLPDPTDRFVTRELVDPSSPSQKITAKVAVPEIQRRESHLKLITEDHPLRSTAVSCLADKDTDRPTILELCNRFAVLREGTKYENSLEHDTMRERNQKVSEQEQLIKEQKRKLEEKTMLIEQLQEFLKNIPSEDSIARMRKELNHKEKQLTRYQAQIADRDDQIREKDSEIRAKNSEILAMKDQLAETERSLTKSEQLRQEAERAKQEVTLTWQEEARRSKGTVQSLREDLSEKREEIEQLKMQVAELSARLSPHNGRHKVSTTSVGDYDSPRIKQTRTQSLKDSTPSSTTPNSTPSSTPDGTPRSGRRVHTWKRPIPTAPIFFKAGSVAVHECNAYFRGAGNNTVYKFDASARKWETAGHPHVQLYGFALVVVESTVTTVGGFDEGGETASGKLYDLVDSNRWVQNLPEMPIRRDRPTAVYADGHLIVLGGCGDNSEPLHTVSILDVSTRQWGKATSLPFSVYQASAITSKDKLYITAGDIQDSNAYALLSCSITALVQSVKPLTLGARIKKGSKKNHWQVLSQLPVRQSYLARADEDLIAVGGMDASDQSSKNVYKYNSSKNTWEVVKEMSIGRSSCLAVVFMDNLLMVVGGHRVPTREAEAITLPQN